MDEYEIELFNPDDETVNFGGRITAQDSLYEVVTLLAILRKDEAEIPSDIPVHSLKQAGKLFLTVGNQWWQFAGDDDFIERIVYCGSFDSNIEAITLADDHLIIGLHSGNVYVVDLNNYKTTIKACICTNDGEQFAGIRLFVGVFVEPTAQEYDGSIRCLMVTTHGQIHRITLSTSDTLRLEHCLLHDVGFRIDTAATTGNLLLLDGKELAVYDVEEDSIEFGVALELESVFPYNFNQFIALTNFGEMLLICANSLLVRRLDASYASFIFYKQRDERLICANTTGEIESIALYKYPQLLQVYAMQVSDVMHLIKSDNIFDAQMFIVRSASGNELRLQIVYETQPQQRLENLLRKRCIVEAEKLAKKYQLDLAPINKAKVEAIVEKVHCEPDEIGQLLELLGSVKDYRFQIMSCLTVTCDSDCMRRVFDYAMKLNPRDFKGNDGEKETLRSELVKTDYLFGTYTMLSRCRYFDDDWSSFQEHNLVDYFIKRLKQMNVEECIVLYSRFDASTMLNLEVGNIEAMLSYLNQWRTPALLTFFNTFIPKTLQHIPIALETIVKWVRQKIYHLEHKCSDEFPSNALHFLQRIIETMNRKVVLMHFDTTEVDCEILDELCQIEQALQTIELLRNNFNINIKLAVCVKGPNAILHDLLHKNMSASRTDEFLNNFLVEFMIKNCFNPDTIFASEISTLVTYKECYWLQIVPSIWRCIGSEEVKLNALLTVLKYASLPWGAHVKEMCHQALKFKHQELVGKLRGELQNEDKYIVLNRAKYGLKFDRLEFVLDCDEMLAINRIIYCNEPTMIEDVRTLCVNDERLARGNHLIVCNYFKKGGCKREAIKFLKNQSQEDISKYVFALSLSVTSYIDYKHVNNEQKRDAVDIVNTAYNLSKQHERNRYVEVHLDALKAVIALRRHFTTPVTCAMFSTTKGPRALYALLLEELTDRVIKQKAMRINDAMHLCKLLAVHFAKNEDAVMLDLIETLGRDFGTICELATYVYENGRDANVMCAMATFIFRVVGMHNIDDSFDDAENVDADVDDTQNLYDCMNVARQLAAKAVMIDVRSESGHYVFTWLRTTIDFLDTVRVNTARLCKRPHYRDNIIAMPFITINGLSKMFSLYCDYLAGSNKLNTYRIVTKYVKKPISAEEFEARIKSDFTQVINNMCSEGSYLTVMQLVETLRNSLFLYHDNFAKELHAALNVHLLYCNTHLVKQTISSDDIAESLTYFVLQTFPIAKSIKIIEQALRRHENSPTNYAKMAKLGTKLLQANNVPPNIVWEKILLMNKWHSLVCFQQKSDVFQLSEKKLAEMMIGCAEVTYEQVAAFCADFDLDVNVQYMVHLKKLLTSWRPVYSVCEEEFGKRRLVLKSTEEELLNACLSIISVIDDKSAVYDFIDNLWSNMNVYYYEVFLCILQLLPPNVDQKLKTMKLELLKFLKTYTRCNPPTGSENEEWFTKFPDSNSVDALAEWRFPLTQTLFTSNVFNILRSELNLTTYTKWFELISVLDNPYFTKTNICNYTVKNVVASGVFKRATNTNEWNLRCLHENLFTQIDECINHMTDEEQATACAYHVTINMPQGADQVKAAEICFKYAQIQKSTGKIKEEKQKMAYTKVFKKYYGYASMHILHCHNLAEEKYLEMVHKPRNLIESLYMDPRIIMLNGISKCPNINRAVNELAALFHIDIAKERETLIEKWLNSGNVTNINLDESIYIEPTVKEDANNTDCDSLLKRIIYICQDGDIETWQDYFVRKGLTGNHKYYFQARCLKCYAAISTNEEILEKIEITNTQLMHFIDKLFLLHDLQCYGLNHTMDQLNQVDPPTLMKKLTKNVSNPLSIKIMASLCMLHRIYQEGYWDLILNTMVKLKMLNEIRKCITFLTDDQFPYNEAYIHAWQYMIDNLFKFGADVNEMELRENMLYLQTCPVFLYLNLNKLLSECMALKKYGYVVWLSQYCCEKVEMVAQVKKCTSLEEMEKELKQLEEFGFFGTQYALRTFAKNCD